MPQQPKKPDRTKPPLAASGPAGAAAPRGRVRHAGKLSVACGLPARAVAGAARASGAGLGLDGRPGSACRWLDIALRTPLRAGPAVAAVSVLRGKDPIRG